MNEFGNNTFTAVSLKLLKEFNSLFFFFEHTQISIKNTSLNDLSLVKIRSVYGIFYVFVLLNVLPEKRTISIALSVNVAG